MPEITQITVEEFDEMSITEKVAAVKELGRKEMAVDVLRVIDAMHGKEIVVRLREFVLHEISPNEHAPARIPGYARRKIAEMVEASVEPPVAEPVEDTPDGDQAEGEDENGDEEEEDFGDEEAAKEAAAEELSESEQPA